MFKWFAANNFIIYIYIYIYIYKNEYNEIHHILHYLLVIEKSKLQEKLNTKFLGLQTDNHIHRKNRTGEMVPELSAACYAVRSMVHIDNVNTFKPI